MPKCFIIMPISTPEFTIPKYSNDKDHFKHVLDHLFIPALTDAGFEAIPPASEGAELIQATIIERLVESDFVLCDMTCLNPNVFFELGIRTALNKPICLVKDDKTDSVPFDTGVINHHTYLSALNTWELAKDVERLSNHAKETLERGDDGNAMWKYFGLSATARPATDAQPGDDLKYLSLQMAAMRKQLSGLSKVPTYNDLEIDPNAEMIRGYARSKGAKVVRFNGPGIHGNPNHWGIRIEPGSLSKEEMSDVVRWAANVCLVRLYISDEV